MVQRNCHGASIIVPVFEWGRGGPSPLEVELFLMFRENPLTDINSYLPFQIRV